MDRQNDGSDFIVCPMLCYSNGTDNDAVTLVKVRGRGLSPLLQLHPSPSRPGSGRCS